MLHILNCFDYILRSARIVMYDTSDDHIFKSKRDNNGTSLTETVIGSQNHFQFPKFGVYCL